MLSVMCIEDEDGGDKFATLNLFESERGYLFDWKEF
jgi:hypothetical protein